MRHAFELAAGRRGVLTSATKSNASRYGYVLWDEVCEDVAADFPGVFEPVHGSAPDIAGRGVANPAGAIWSASLMLEHVGEPEAAARLMEAIEKVCRDGTRTRDIGGTASTMEVGDAVAREAAA